MIELDGVARAARRVDAGAALHVRVCDTGQSNQSDCEFKRGTLVRIDANSDVAQAQIERETKVVLLRQNRSKRPANETVRAGRIPSRSETLIGCVPGEQIGVADQSPASRRRIGVERFRPTRGGNSRHRQSEQHYPTVSHVIQVHVQRLYGQ